MIQFTKNKSITGYWLNWKSSLRHMEGFGSTSDSSYYKPSFKPYSHIMYAFLTLTSRPNPDMPPDEFWDGSNIYQTMTLAPVLKVMNDQSYTYNWQSNKIKAMIKACN